VTIATGTRLGPYWVVALVASGGQGDIYRARDPRLGRDVALKVLPEDWVLDPAHQRRLEREARTAGALNHPNILAVYDVGFEAGAPYVVTELLEGQTLREQSLVGGIARILELAVQIASGLAAAHGRGIVHRDIKPENLFLTSDGVVKILDFGLARHEHSAAGTASMTLDTLTDSGSHGGTTPYLSPEQALRLPLDHRSDIFSFGVTLFEMVTGRRPFLGETRLATIAAILHDDPPSLAALNPQAPPALENVVRRCLEKRAENRFQSAHDLALALESVAVSLGAPPSVYPTAETPAASPAAASWRPRFPGPAAWSALLVVVAGLLVARERHEGTSADPTGTPEPRPVTSYPGAEFQPALSPDGDRVAFTWRGDGDNDDIYVKLTAAEPPLRLTVDPASDCCPAWSPDGQSIAFLRSNGPAPGIYLVPSLGGREQFLHPARAWFGSALSWTPDGDQIVFSAAGEPDEPPRLWRLSLRSLERAALTRPPDTAIGDALPSVSPRGDRVAFARIASAGDLLMNADIFAAPLDGRTPRRLTHLDRFVGGLDWTPDGEHIVFSSRVGNAVGLRRVDAAGGEASLFRTPWPAEIDQGGDSLALPSRAFRLSSARHRSLLAFSNARFDLNIWLLTLPDLAARRLPFASTFNDAAPDFSPDGRWIAYGTRRSGAAEVWICDVAGTTCDALTRLGGHSGSPAFAPDSSAVAFDSRPRGNADIFVTRVGVRGVRRLTDHGADDVVPSWSRDGRLVYFASNRSGRWEIWRKPVAHDGPARQMTTGGGFSAAESPDGRWLYHARLEEPGLWRVPLAGGPAQAITSHLGCWGSWAVGARGLYLIDTRSGQSVLERIPWDSETPETLGAFEGSSGCSDKNLAVAPDEGSLLVARTDIAEGDVLLLEDVP